MNGADTGVRFVLCVTVLAALATGLWMAMPVRAQADGPIPGGTYSGTMVDTSGVCDEGQLTLGEEISLRLNAHGTGITDVIVSDLSFQGSSFGSLAVPVGVRIEEDGTFVGDIEPFGLADVHIEGRFGGDAVSGSFRVEVGGTVECAATFTAQGSPPPERPPTTLVGEIEIVDEDCGGGTILVTVAGDGLSVVAAEVQDFNARGTVVSGSATFDEGTVPIAEDWTFGWLYFPGGEVGQEIAVSGRFTPGALFLLSGVVTVSPSTCGAVPIRLLPTSLGQGGTGPQAYRASAQLVWATILGAAGLAALAAGVAVQRRAC